MSFCMGCRVAWACLPAVCHFLASLNSWSDIRLYWPQSWVCRAPGRPVTTSVAESGRHLRCSCPSTCCPPLLPFSSQHMLLAMTATFVLAHAVGHLPDATQSR